MPDKVPPTARGSKRAQDGSGAVLMSPDKKQERLVLFGLLGLFFVIGLMLLFVSVLGGGIAGE